MGNRQTGPKSEDYHTYNPGNQLTSDRERHYVYDGNGNLIGKTETDDGETETWTYAYDGENRLISVVKQEGVETKTVTFKYDSFGRRIEKRVTEDGTTRTRRYFYDNEDILFEYDENGVIGNRYLHGPGIDEPLSVTTDGGTYYYHADGLGSIIALTDAEQKVVQDYEYDAFGNLHDQKNAVKQPYAYTGREWDKETKLYYYRARYYDPKVGRFVSKDPIGFAGGDVNLYGYAQNNPVNYTDPTGLYTKCCAGNTSGEWRRVHWARLFNAICICYWLCEPPSGSIWSGNPYGLPSTYGTIFFDPTIFGEGAGDIESGNNCLCGPPG